MAFPRIHADLCQALTRNMLKRCSLGLFVLVVFLKKTKKKRHFTMKEKVNKSKNILPRTAETEGKLGTDNKDEELQSHKVISST